MRKNSSSYKEGDIVILELPFADLIGKKLRPVLVLSSEELNLISADLIVAKISSSQHLQKVAKKASWQGDELGEVGGGVVGG